jgi:Fusaric acid resistance protein-like/Phosphotransferase enzyme family
MPGPPSPVTAPAARRLAGNPILHRDTHPGVGRNINGPSLIAAPPWLERPLGRYYLYFAHHRGSFIRLATADRLGGPWSVYQPGTLRLEQSHFPTEGRRPHIASPDVHVDPVTQTVRMYYHGLDTATRVQHTRVATSADGVHFEARPELLGRPYFRVFTHDGWWYALGMPGILYRSADGLSGFERGPRLFGRDMRHSALLVRNGELLVFWSRVGDTPERILCSRIPLLGDWRTWHAGPPADVLEPEYPWEGADQPHESSVRGWEDEPVRQLRDPAIFCEDDHTYLLYSVAGESGIAIAELDEPQAKASGPQRRRLTQVKQHLTGKGLERTRRASVTMAATLASFGTALLIEHAARLSTSVLVLSVALALSMGRLNSRPGREHTGWSRLLGVIVLPLVAVGANEIGTRMLQHPNIGDTLFVLAVSATIYVRRFGPLASRLATVATLPLIAMLIVPAPVVATPGSSGDQRLWSALIALVAMAWVTAAELLASRTGLLPRPPLPRQTAGSSGPEAQRKHSTSSGPVLASTRMSLQMGAALGAAFVVGRNLFPEHLTWVVLTAFIVCSGNRGRGDVVHKALMRLLGASLGTLAATALTGLLPVGNRWSVVAIFAVLAVALWLRPLNYAYWAAGMTAALALLYGYYGERGPGLLADRLEAIVIGAAVGVAASWFLLPVRTTDVIRKDAARALAALAGYPTVAATEPAELAGHQARFQQAADALDRIGRILRLVPRRWRTGPAAYVPAITALHRSAAALPAITRRLAGPGEHELDPATLTTLNADITALRRGIGARAQPDPAAWDGLAESIILLPASLKTAGTRPSRDRLRPASERVLGYINRVHGTSYQLLSRLGGTDPSCVYLLDGTGGNRAVLKWCRDPATAAQAEQAASLIAAARAAGWPVSAWLASGATPSGFPYRILDYAPGAAPGRVTSALAAAVLPVIGSQAGLAPDGGPDWSAHDQAVVFANDGGHATTLASFSAQGAALVAAVRAWAEPFRSVTLAAGDLVHGHLVPGNVLLDDGRVTALTGAEGLGKGSRMHDVASLAVHALLWDGEQGALEALLGYAADQACPGEFEVSLAARLLSVLGGQVTVNPGDAGRLIGESAAVPGRLGQAGLDLARAE